MQNVEAQVIKITSETLGIEEGKITSKSNFVTDLGADSLDQVELMMAFEVGFDKNIPDEDASKLLTIEAVVNYIKEKLFNEETDASEEYNVKPMKGG